MGKQAKLTDKQRRFVHEYLIDLNGKAAAERAGYSRNCARGVASRMLKSPKVAEYIAQARKDQEARLEISADRVLLELARIAFVDPSRIMTISKVRRLNRVSITPTDKMSEDERRCIAELSESVQGGIRCKLHDKQKALELLGRHLGLFVDRLEHSGPGGGPIRHSPDALSDDELERIVASEPVKG